MLYALNNMKNLKTSALEGRGARRVRKPPRCKNVK